MSLSIRVMLMINIQKQFQIWRQKQDDVLCKILKLDMMDQAGTGSVDGPKVKLTLQEQNILRLLHLSWDKEDCEGPDAVPEQMVKIYSSMLLQLLHYNAIRHLIRSSIFTVLDRRIEHRADGRYARDKFD